MSTPWQINVFGIRHLSPAGAWHLRAYLDAQKPELVLIEGLADANELIHHITKKGTRPPIALLAYTDALVLAFGRVDEAIFDAMREHLDDEAILEFTYITMMYAMHAVITRALRLEFDDRDDPIVEVPAPADYKPANLGRQIAFDTDDSAKS